MRGEGRAMAGAAREMKTGSVACDGMAAARRSLQGAREKRERRPWRFFSVPRVPKAALSRVMVASKFGTK
jgi:hypothetical protein